MIKPRPFQKEGIKFLESKRYALLADEMGLGKTIQAILAARASKLILVVCPACAKINWQREFKNVDNRDAFIIETETINKIPKDAKIFIVSFDYLVAHLKFFTDVSSLWHLVIVDESHFVKEPTTKRTKAVFGNEGILHRTMKMWLLSGTPAPSHAGELWTMLYTFGHTKYTYEGFIARYCTSYSLGKYNRTQITGTNLKHIKEVKEMLGKMSLRRLKKDVLPELPPKTFYTHYLESDYDPFKNNPELKLKMKLEYKMLSEKINFYGDTPDDDKLLNALSLMAQSVPTLRRYHGLKKMQATIELIKQEFELELYDKLVIFAIHTDIINTITYCLSHLGAVSFTGKTSKKDRQAAIDNFQNKKSCKVFVGNIKAAGTAITLTAANQGIFVELDWTPSDKDQPSDRLHRMGQTKHVSFRIMALANSFDEKITATLTRKIRELSHFI